jgi:hypothetical protein
MENDTPRPTRKHGRHLRVPVLPDEELAIKRKAADTGLSVASYLRNVGLGFEVRGIVDNQQVEILARINGDLGRLGGLLKLWLTSDMHMAQFSEASIRTVLDKIGATQGRLIEVMATVLMHPRDP